MKKIILIFALTLAGSLPVIAQSNPTDRIQRPCGTGATRRAIVITNADGSVDITSCTGDPVNINGVPYPSGGAIGGSGTTNNYAIFTAAQTIGNGLLTQTAWPNIVNLLSGSFAYGGIAAPAVSAAGRGKLYFDSTSNTLKASYNAAAFFDVARSNYTTGTLPLGGAGGLLGNSFASQSGNNFTIAGGAAGSVLTLQNSTGTDNLIISGAGHSIDLTANNVNYISADGVNDIVRVGRGVAKGSFDSANAVVTLGDVSGGGNNVRLDVNDAAQAITLRSSGTAQIDVNGAGTVALGDTQGGGNGTTVTLTDSSQIITLSAASVVNVYSGSATGLVGDASSGTTRIGDVQGTANLTRLTVDDAAQTYTFSKLTNCLGLTTDGNGTVGCIVSDAKLKTNRVRFSRGLDALARLKPESYNFVPGRYYNNGARRTGLIAQNVLAAIPEAVSKTGDGVLQIDNTTVLATAINAINELRARVESLEKQNAQLRRRVRRQR